MKTIISEDTNVKNNTPAVESKNAPKWREAVIGGIPGIALGAGGILIAESLTPSALAANESAVPMEEPLEAPEQNDIFVPETCAIASGVNDDMTFSQAFAAARAEVGLGGVFEWHGHLYGTYYKTEWEAMTDEQKSDYWEAVSEVHIEHAPADDAAESAADDIDPNAAELAEEAAEAEDSQISEEEGFTAEVSDAESEEGFIDAESEEEYLDAESEEIVEDDEVIEDESEIIDLSEQETPEDAIEGDPTESPEEDLYASNPDYTNDADTSALV